MNFFKSMTPLLFIEIVLFSAFWIFTLLGGIDEFNTLVFIGQGFTYWIIAMSILTGMLIGGTIERFNNRGLK